MLLLGRVTNVKKEGKFIRFDDSFTTVVDVHEFQRELIHSFVCSLVIGK